MPYLARLPSRWCQGSSRPGPRRPALSSLWAKEVRLNVLRTGSQNELENLIAEDNVHVKQEGETPKDKGVDIQGNMLNLVQHEKGKVLWVDGDEHAANEKKYARLMMNDMVLVGPKITINQKDNIAQADGEGFLNMPSNANLDGSKTAKTDALDRALERVHGVQRP